MQCRRTVVGFVERASDNKVLIMLMTLNQLFNEYNITRTRTERTFHRVTVHGYYYSNMKPEELNRIEQNFNTRARQKQKYNIYFNFYSSSVSFGCKQCIYIYRGAPVHNTINYLYITTQAFSVNILFVTYSRLLWLCAWYNFKRFIFSRKSGGNGTYYVVVTRGIYSVHWEQRKHRTWWTKQILFVFDNIGRSILEQRFSK
jgi:hypothetical protein